MLRPGAPIPPPAPRKAPARPPPRFSAQRLRALDATKYLRIRAGAEHRFIAVWVVVVEGRALVRPWNDRPDGWYRAFLADPRGAIELDGRLVKVRTRRPRGEAILDAMDAAYAAKYATKANAAYVEGFATPRRRATTLELVPG